MISAAGLTDTASNSSTVTKLQRSPAVSTPRSGLGAIAVSKLRDGLAVAWLKSSLAGSIISSVGGGGTVGLARARVLPFCGVG